jgi:membrane protease YdiL (CAAX protease family)
MQNIYTTKVPLHFRAPPDGYTRVADLKHTILVLVILGLWTFFGDSLAQHVRAATHPDRVRFYGIGMLFEWVLFFVVLAGVRRSGASFLSVLGERWRSIRQVLRDIGIAAGFWILTLPLLGIISWLLRIPARGPDLQFMLPNRGTELAWWIALSVTAGICEETIFRGYLQRELLALTKSAPTAILLSAAAFGAAHAYQGLRRTILLGLYGAMFGLLAHWRGTVRPGMIAHGWQDVFTGLLASVRQH